MRTAPLRSFLKSLCNNSCWNHAVFWKLQQHNQMFLIWEDGYFDTLNEKDSVENVLADISFEDLKETSSSCTYHQGAMDVDVGELAVAYMSSVEYAFGEGVIGDVAYTGNYRWVFLESKPSGEVNTTLFPKNADEWLFLFTAGVKTILLVPVLPHGVLQLGSMETISEDASMATYIKDEFVAHRDFMGYSEVFEMNRLLAQSPSSSMSMLMKNLDEFPSFMMKGMCSDNSTAIDNVQWANRKPLTKRMSPCDMLRSSISATEADCSGQLGAIGLSEIFHLSANLSELGVIESSKCRPLDEGVPPISYCNNLSTGAFGGRTDRPLWTEIQMKQSLLNDIGSVLSFPKECELHKALGPAFAGKTNDDEDSYSSSSQIRKKNLVWGTASSATKTNEYEDVENLLGDVVTSVHGGESFIQTRGGSLSTSSFGHVKSAFGGESSLSRNHVESTYMTRGKNLTDSSSPSANSHVGVITELIEEGDRKCGYDSPHQRKGPKSLIGSKRRGKPGVKQKPRPRDRQLIQDRLKELREHVPDGANCSIDGLLDRTVRHMLFLKSISDRADKLMQCAQPKGVGEHKRSSHNGASWAFELEGNKEICPIIIEDLQYPGHMIIEMICDESGRFFEIAEVIHGLDLKILKGVVERRSGNTWAHFVIEAPRGLHRLDIFWPLMKLLQQQHGPISSKI